MNNALLFIVLAIVFVLGFLALALGVGIAVYLWHRKKKASAEVSSMAAKSPLQAVQPPSEPPALSRAPEPPAPAPPEPMSAAPPHNPPPPDPPADPDPPRDRADGAQDQIEAMMETFQKVAREVQTTGAADPEAISGAMSRAIRGDEDDSAQLVKQVSCPSCGAGKVQPSKTAWLYCDFCGTLIDWDFKAACRESRTPPGPAYEALLSELKGELDAARERDDRASYHALQRRLFAAHFDASPGAWSPRLGDPEYREALLEYTAACYTEAAFDPECQRLEQAMSRAFAEMDWPALFAGESRQFMRAVEAFIAHNERFLDVTVHLLPQHPDHMTRALGTAISASAFVQGWVPYLKDEDRDTLLRRLNLHGEYHQVRPVDTERRHCGGCGSPLDVPKGARRVICESCGRASDVSRAEIACMRCGTPLSAPHGAHTFSCPACSMELTVHA